LAQLPSSFLHMMSWQRGCAVKGALEQGIKAARVLVVLLGISPL
jgi:hypothetical protein